MSSATASNLATTLTEPPLYAWLLSSSASRLIICRVFSIPTMLMLPERSGFRSSSVFDLDLLRSLLVVVMGPPAELCES